ncbi:g6127 [Coccomyxa viridis]|uniref:G6127 protein n=1 Tax=Coccomyxa viridis TaxID=1274662 RepID=A0ABP1FYK2_9CHLO
MAGSTYTPSFAVHQHLTLPFCCRGTATQLICLHSWHSQQKTNHTLTVNRPCSSIGRKAKLKLWAAGFESATASPNNVGSGGKPELMKVQFREVDTFNLWIWLEMAAPPSEDDADMLDTVLTSWFMIGRLGGYNSMNLQAAHVGGSSVSFMDYDQSQSDTALQALFHDMGAVEQQGSWCRCWFDLGTADELGLDVLINTLTCFSKENVGIKQLIIGGVNKDWPVPKKQAGLI